ncbi:MAG: HNH endonuclease [Gemmatimonadales bacterium]|nr:HNH endonuclease [Gemmatimonadales bacterium]
MHVDHIVPLSEGGMATLDNLQAGTRQVLLGRLGQLIPTV